MNNLIEQVVNGDTYMEKKKELDLCIVEKNILFR